MRAAEPLPPAPDDLLTQALADLDELRAVVAAVAVELDIRAKARAAQDAGPSRPCRRR